MTGYRRNSGLARHSGLAKAAAITLKTILGSDKFSHLFQNINPAFQFIVPRFAYGSGRAPLDTLLACSMGEKKTILIMALIRPPGRRNMKAGHDRTATHRLAKRGNQAIAEAKGPQS